MQRRAQEIVSIQYLRGIASTMVVAFHALRELGHLNIHPAPVVESLSAGVDIFFVISGFVMWHTTYDRDRTPGQFYLDRILRIVPMYWLISTVMLIVMLAHPSAVQSARFDTWHVIASYAFLPHKHPSLHTMEPLLIPGWSLNLEMFFYLVFGLALVLRDRRARICALCVVFALLTTAGAMFKFPPEVAFYTQSLILEFAAGALLGFLYARGASVGTRMSVFLFVLGALLLAGSFYGAALANAISRGIPALMIVAGAVFYERRNGIPAHWLHKRLGDASYSTYLSHPLPQSAITQAFVHFGATANVFVAATMVTLEIAVSLVVGWVTYATTESFFIEKAKVLRKAISERSAAWVRRRESNPSTSLS